MERAIESSDLVGLVDGLPPVGHELLGLDLLGRGGTQLGLLDMATQHRSVDNGNKHTQTDRHTRLVDIGKVPASPKGRNTSATNEPFTSQSMEKVIGLHV
jgi:hypothetical protein